MPSDLRGLFFLVEGWFPTQVCTRSKQESSNMGDPLAVLVRCFKHVGRATGGG